MPPLRMMKTTSHSGDKFPQFYNLGARSFFLFYLICFGSFYFFYVYFAPTSVKFTPKIEDGSSPIERTNSSAAAAAVELPKGSEEKDQCDLFKGKWVWDDSGDRRYYTNFSCRAIPYLRNCLLHGRPDRDFLHWRWKPEQCHLRRFQPGLFLDIVKGKTMAFIGDSLARNQMKSLVCLLSQEETPIEVENEGEDEFQKWHFSQHNFTLMALRSHFLVKASDIVINGSSTGGFHLHLDKIDDRWSRMLPEMDYAIFSDAHWFFRQNYLYDGGKLIGCIYCQVPNVTDLGPGYAISRAFRLAFKLINECKRCSSPIATYLRTYSPAHFAGAEWNKGGYCNRTSPQHEIDTTDNWEFRDIQIEEIERAKKEVLKNGNTFEVIDVTRAMQMRPDGHPGIYWGNKWMKGYNDCIHWCLPGPIDAWNEFLFEMMLRRKKP